jgi:asparagine synthase (glutamine-hydrolysing)
VCGILGIVTTRSRRVAMSDDAASRLRDLLTHRGPDGAGLWRAPAGNALLAHRRLAVIDPSPAGHQPFLSSDSHHALVYNGELYNDHELRAELSSLGVRFRTACDTETVLAALEQWGVDALSRFRGMFALAWLDTRRHRLLLARDPFGMKPLYFWISQGDHPLAIFASEPTPILAHPDVPVRPDLAGVSAYLTTIRTTLGHRTMFEGVRTLRPGEALELDLSGDEIGLRLERHWTSSTSGSLPIDIPEAARRVGSTLRDAVRLHMRSDVPTCALLSGGLDSSAIVASMSLDAAATNWSNRTYCSGARTGGDNGDFEFARMVADRFQSVHTEAPITREMFSERWPWMVARMGTPLSTPNEVAINEIARRLRADGQVVALSGEGADELFAGYDLPMSEAATFEAHRRPGVSPGEHQLNANAWIPLQTKGVLLTPDAWRAAEHDAALRAFYADEFDDVEAECGPSRDPLDPHLRFHRRINLAGLLQRLDTATMLESVEGRTPFADRAVAELAEGLPLACKYSPASGDGQTPAGTKLALRAAFANALPAEVVRRPKASFPLPFQEWVTDRAADLRSSSLAREFFSLPAIEMVAADPSRHWRAAWPMINIAIWAKRWWS